MCLLCGKMYVPLNRGKQTDTRGPLKKIVGSVNSETKWNTTIVCKVICA